MDYNKIAEFIVKNVPSVVPEYVGGLLADAEAVIPSYLKGEERSAALNKRVDAGKELMDIAVRHGYQFHEGLPSAESPTEKPVSEQRIHDIAEKAQLAFWAVIAEEFPEVRTGDFPPDATYEFNQACELALKQWLMYNYPK